MSIKTKSFSSLNPSENVSPEQTGSPRGRSRQKTGSGIKRGNSPALIFNIISIQDPRNPITQSIIRYANDFFQPPVEHKRRVHILATITE